MNAYDWIQLAVFTAAFIALTPFLGSFMARVFEGERHILSTPLDWMESGIYLVSGVDRNEEMNWKRYAWAMTVFNAIGLVVVFTLQMFQSQLPLNPQAMPNTSWHLAFNTAVSFVTNTNWQSYSGETTMSYLTQTLGLAVQNFVSAATGIAVLLALIRGIARRSSTTLGNFWTDLTRTTVYILIPLSVALALALASQGVVQTFSSYVEAHTIEGAKQTLALGPAASQIAIKQLGSNGGGFFNANAAHPFENPTPLSNWLEMLSLILIPAALTYSYGIMVKSKRQGWVLFGAMLFMWAGALAVSLYAEYATNPLFGVGALMEGKETRFGVMNSVLWSVTTSATSNGSVNSMHASLSPISGGVALFNIMLGEIVFGGVGSGLYGMLLFIFLAVFLAGLMVGRTPEYLGKKIETKEIAMVVVAILLPSICILVGSGISAVLPAGVIGLANKGPHGLSEILYAFTSASQNNGSAFAGLAANTPYYNVMLGICMLIGRFGVIYPVLAIAGNLAAKKYAPLSEGTFRTDNVLFIILLIAVILVVGALTHLPPLSLGPIAEHFLMAHEITF